MNAKLKGWLVEHKLVSETASEEDFRAALAKAIADGTLSQETLYELMAPDDDMAKTITEAVAESVAPLAKQVAEVASELDAMKKQEPDGITDLAKRVDELTTRAEGARQAAPPPKDSETPPAKMLAGSDGASAMPRVKAVPEMFDGTKGKLYYPKDHRAFPNQPAMFGVDHASMGEHPIPLPEGIEAGPPVHLESLSELDKAVCGAFFKKAAGAQNLSGRPLPRCLRWTDLDEQIWQYSLREVPWTGIVGSGASDKADESCSSPKVVNGQKLTDYQRKTLLDDSTSGGTEAAPIVFDTAVITTPVLFGELFPLVSVVPVSRGRRMEGFAIGNPSFTSGTAEGTAISLFNTAGMITAFDTNIHNAVGAIKIGLDFEQDSPAAIGALVTQRYGDCAKEWLDNQIANGDGTSEPQGVFNASGITDIGNPAGGANAAPQPDDYITLWGSVAKQYRPKSDQARCVYIANDTSYRRAKNIQVGTTDERRVFGMTLSEYTIFEYPFKVQNDIANTVAGFFAMKYYRMYRRLGLTVRVETGGETLARENVSLIVVRMRWGGRLELGGAGAYSDNWQT